MSTSWTLTAQEICEDAFQHLGKIKPGDMPDAADLHIALRALDAVLKELPLAGFTWPKLSAETALTWLGGQTIALPADYLGRPALWRTQDGRRVPMRQIPHADWVRQLDRTGTGTPTHFYISPANILSLFPVPTVDPGIVLQYQVVVDDAALASVPNVPQYMINALGFGVAHETSLKFAHEKPLVRQEIAARWLEKRATMIAHSFPNENADRVTVAD